MFEKSLKLEKKRIIRIGISFVIFFVLLNVVVAYALPSFNQTLRASEILLDQNVCNFTEKDFKEIEYLVKNEEKPKIDPKAKAIAIGYPPAGKSGIAS